ncbi:MAG: AI-2E family transporter [Thiothrix sp.]|nr:MAG: AI-2E family transporter [Thiothrix sp.]
MIAVIKDWYNSHFSDPQVVLLALLLIFGFAVIILAGEVLAPVLAAVVIAYLLDGLVEHLLRVKIPRWLAVIIVFLVFMGLVLAVMVWLMPLLFGQAAQFFSEVPRMAEKGQRILMQLPERYPTVVTESDVISIISQIRAKVAIYGQGLLSRSFSSMMNLLTILVYLVLVPVLAFFFLMDKQKIFDWIGGFLPRERGLSMQVWQEMNSKIASYTRGKFLEIMLIWSVSFFTFTYLELNYAMLLAVIVGLSVIIPYVGAAAATLPIVLIGYFQWGFSYDFMYVIAAYAVIQFLDGNLLVPLLFSEIVNLHPIAIITAVLVFGSIWGIWGVFFAIPLATLVQAVLNAWPQKEGAEELFSEGQAK